MKAICVFSGGLDSILAAQLIRTQGTDVLGLFFETPFFSSSKAKKSAENINLPIKIVDITKRHLEVVKNPKHGFGGNMNPCIDCHSLMFRIAGEMLESEGAKFILTGEVLGQRPMSQNKKSLHTVAVESGLNRLLLRPLSAKRLPITIPEEKGWVDRERLLGISGRSRKSQIALAKTLNVHSYPSPAGGCLLTEKDYSRKLKDLLTTPTDVKLREIKSLKLGRHFRIAPDSKLVVGRNRKDNEAIRSIAENGDLLITSTAVPGPTALIFGKKSVDAIKLGLKITAAYCDSAGKDIVDMLARDDAGEKKCAITVSDKKEFRRYMI